MRVLKLIGFYLLSFTWGIVMTLVGFIAALVMLITGHKPQRFHYIIFFRFGKSWGGVSFGPVAIICKESTVLSILPHEHGHSFQNTWWGPLFPIIIGIPSMIRYWYRELTYKAKRKALDKGKITMNDFYEWYSKVPDYDSIWFEGQATKLGDKIIKNLWE